MEYHVFVETTTCDAFFLAMTVRMCAQSFAGVLPEVTTCATCRSTMSTIDGDVDVVKLTQGTQGTQGRTLVLRP